MNICYSQAIAINNETYLCSDVRFIATYHIKYINYITVST